MTPPRKRAKRDVVKTEEPLILEMSHKCRNKEFIARKQDSPIFPSNNIVPIVVPNYANVNSSIDFILTPGHVRKCYE